MWKDEYAIFCSNMQTIAETLEWKGAFYEKRKPKNELLLQSCEYIWNDIAAEIT